MRLSFAPLLLLPFAVPALSEARMHYERDCHGNRWEFTFPKDAQCVRLPNGYASSLYFALPGEPYYAVAYREGSKSACGKEVCNVNALASKRCCNSSRSKVIKGAERFRIGPGGYKMRRDTVAVDDSDEDCVDVAEIGGVFGIAVGDDTIEVPNRNASLPTEDEIRDALVDADVEDVESYVERAVADLQT